MNGLKFGVFVVALLSSPWLLANTCPDAPVTKLRSKISGATLDDAQAYTQGAFYEMGVCACLSGKLLPQANVAGLKGRSMIAQKNARQYKPGINLRPWPAQCKFASNKQTAGAAEQDLSVDYGRVMKYAARLQAVTDGFARQIEQVSDLTTATDPTALVAEFQTKMNNLQRIDQNMANSQLNRTARGVEQMADAATNLNETSFYQSIGSLASLYDLSEARAEAKARQAQLQAQQRSQMSQFYWQAVNEANQQMEDYSTRAAFAEDENVERYWFAMVDHLKCYQKSMRDRWQPNTTNWLENNCPLPAPVQPGIPNNLISADRKALQLAERKYNRYLGASGVGLEVDAVNQHGFWQVVVVNVEPMSPADLAGIQRNDTIMAIYGHPTKGVALDLTPDELKLFANAELSNQRQIIRTMEASIASQQKTFDSKTVRRLQKKDPEEYARLERLNQQAIAGAQSSIKMAQLQIAKLEAGDRPPQYNVGVSNRTTAELIENYIESGRVRWLTVGTETVNLEPRGPAAFRTAAIAFASRAQNIKPTPETNLKLAKYHEEENEMFALSYLYAALDQGAVFSQEDLARLSRLEAFATTAFQKAIQNNETQALQALIDSGLHERFVIGGDDLLTLTMKMDEPEAVQVILNAYVANTSEQERQRMVQGAMLKLAEFNSAESLAHLFTLGLEQDFSLNGKTLRSEALANNSDRVLTLLDTGSLTSQAPATQTSGSSIDESASQQSTFVLPPGGEQEFMDACIAQLGAMMATMGTQSEDTLATLCRQQLDRALGQP